MEQGERHTETKEQHWVPSRNYDKLCFKVGGYKLDYFPGFYMITRLASKLPDRNDQSLIYTVSYLAEKILL